MIFFAVGESLRVIHSHMGRSLEITLQKLGDPAWFLNAEDHRTKATIRRHCKLAFSSLKAAYENAKKDPGFRHRNWFRLQSTLEAAHTQLENLWPIISESSELYTL